MLIWLQTQKMRMKIRIMFILVLLTSFGCSKEVPKDTVIHKEKKEVTRYWDTGKPSQIIPYVGDSVEGTAIQYWDDGKIFSISGKHSDGEFYRIILSEEGDSIMEWGVPFFFQRSEEPWIAGEAHQIDFIVVDFPGFAEEVYWRDFDNDNDENDEEKLTSRTRIGIGESSFFVTKMLPGNIQVGFEIIYRPSNKMHWQQLEVFYDFYVQPAPTKTKK